MRILAKPALNIREPNPYARLLYTQITLLGEQVEDYSPWKAIRNRYDICHIHWPEYYIAQRNWLKAFVGSGLLLLLVFWCRIRGAKIVWTVHNLASHNRIRPRAERCFWWVFTRFLDGYIALTEGGSAAARECFPALVNLPSFVIPHGHYREAYPNTISRKQARSDLQVPQDAKVFLFFGAIAPYKNVPALAKTVRENGISGALLLIAGACSSGSEEALLRLQSDDPRIRLHLGFVPAERVQVYFVASDLVVLPFSDILNSGSALLALSFGRPILVPAKGAMLELALQAGPQWVRTYQAELTARELNRALDWAINEHRSQVPAIDNLDWGVLAAKTLQAYKTLVGRTEVRVLANAPQ